MTVKRLARRALKRIAVPTLLLVCVHAPALVCQEAAADSGEVTRNGSPSGWSIGPVGRLYPDYLADPRRPQMSLGLQLVDNSDLVEDFGSGDTRTDVRLGGRAPLVRYATSGAHAWELSLEAGFFGLFDTSHSLDNIGWDGVYGLLLAWRFAPGFTGKFHARHLSGHLGDEFIDRTGRERIEYTREDLVAGLAWEPLRGAAVFGEIGVGLHDAAGKQEALQLHFGAQYRDDDAILGDVFDWQIAADIQMLEEEDFTPEVTLSGALLLPMVREGQQLRIGVEVHTGRMILTELSDLEEDYVCFLIGWDF